MVRIRFRQSKHQNFNCTVPVGKKNINLKFHLVYSEKYNVWHMDIYDAKSGSCYVAGRPLIIGSLLEQYQHMCIGNAYLLPLYDDRELYGDNLSRFALYWGDI